jgi:hypothetical protein
MVPCAKVPGEHDGVSRALVKPRRARRDDVLCGKRPAGHRDREPIAELGDRNELADRCGKAARPGVEEL